MFKKIAIIAVFAAISSCFNATSQAQYGGVQVRIGGYGPSAPWGGYGNGYNSYYSGWGNSYRYGNDYQLGYGNYAQPSAVYMNGRNYGGYRSYPTVSYGYVAPRYYYSNTRNFSPRRFR